MLRTILIALIGICSFIIAVMLESNLVGYSSIFVMAASFISLTWESWKIFLKMKPIEMNSYGVHNLTDIDTGTYVSNYYFCLSTDIC